MHAAGHEGGEAGGRGAQCGEGGEELQDAVEIARIGDDPVLEHFGEAPLNGERANLRSM